MLSLDKYVPIKFCNSSNSASLDDWALRVFLCTSVPACACVYYKVEDHKHAVGAHGPFSPTVALLSICFNWMRTGRKVCAESVHLAEASAKVSAKQGSLQPRICFHSFKSMKGVVVIISTRCIKAPDDCPSVRQTRGLGQNKRKFCPDLYTTWKIYPSFPAQRMVGEGRLLLPEILGQTGHVRAKKADF